MLISGTGLILMIMDSSFVMLYCDKDLDDSVISIYKGEINYKILEIRIIYLL